MNNVIQTEMEFEKQIKEWCSQSNHYKQFIDLLFKIYELKNIHNNHQFFFNHNKIKNFSDLFVLNQSNIDLMNDLVNNKFKCYNITFSFPISSSANKDYECFVILKEENDFSEIMQYFYKQVKRSFRFVETDIEFTINDFKIKKQVELNCVDFYQKLIPIALLTFNLKLKNYQDLNPNINESDVEFYIQQNKPIIYNENIQVI